MWTDITRGQYRRDKLKYASDLTEAEWLVLVSQFAQRGKRRGRPRHTDLRRVIQAIFYVLETGCQWRMLPDSFPPRSTVQRYFYAWRDDGTWRRINHALLMLARERMGREATLRQLLHQASPDGASSWLRPSAGVIDSQSVKTTEAGGVRGYDAGKKTKGRKRHIITDTNGLLVGAVVHSADIQDRDGAPQVLASIRTAFPWLRHIFADGGYAGEKLETALESVPELYEGFESFRIIRRIEASWRKASAFRVLF